MHTCFRCGRPTADGTCPHCTVGWQAPESAHRAAAAPRLAPTAADEDGSEHTGARPKPAPVVQLRAAEADEPRSERSSSSPPARPPVLASEALRRDLIPATPGETLARVLAIVLGALGVAAVVVLGAEGLTLPMAVALGAIALLGVAPIPFGARAAAVVTLCGGGAAIVLSAGGDGGVSRALLTIGVAVLGAGLLLRTWHRASRASRVLVAAGVVACGVWLWQTRALTGLTILDTAWQAWLPEVAPVGLALALVLSLLAFMDSASTGGCGVWATVLLSWYAATRWLALAAVAWPAQAREPSLARLSSELVLTDALLPFFVVLLAVGMAQSFAALGHRGT